MHVETPTTRKTLTEDSCPPFVKWSALHELAAEKRRAKKDCIFIVFCCLDSAHFFVKKHALIDPFSPQPEACNRSHRLLWSSNGSEERRRESCLVKKTRKDAGKFFFWHHFLKINLKKLEDKVVSKNVIKYSKLCVSKNKKY